MKNKLISVIISVYKAEKYLEGCLDSICNQTYRELEIILVDDGSPDNSGKICDEYAKRDNRVLVIHKENGGISSGRNAGIKVAKGEYLIFYDSDDFVPNNSVEDLYNTCEKDNADIAMCGFIKKKNGKILLRFTGKNGIFNKDEALKRLLEETDINCTVWNKIFKKESIKNIYFDENLSVAEDFKFLYQAFKKVNKISINTNKIVYHYEVRNGSLMQGRFNQKFIKEVTLCSDILEEIKIENSKLERAAIKRYQRSMVSCLSKCLKENGNIEEIKYMINDLKKYPLELTGYNKIRYYLLLYCKWGLKLIYKVYDRI